MIVGAGERSWPKRDSKHSFICGLTTAVLAHSCASKRRSREQSLQTAWVLALRPASITSSQQTSFDLPPLTVIDSVRCIHKGTAVHVNACAHTKIRLNCTPKVKNMDIHEILHAHTHTHRPRSSHTHTVHLADNVG